MQGADRKRWNHGAIATPLLVAAAHWVVVQASASLAYRFSAPYPSSPPYKAVLGDPPALSGVADVLVGPLRLWDGLWYRLIAEHGYGPIAVPGQGTYELGARSAFWPLYPWLMEGGHRLLGVAPETAGYLVANLAFVAALIAVYRLVASDFDQAVATRTIWALALFPTSLFFSAVYTESLFLALAAWALLCARTGGWWAAGTLGLLAALTRSQGVLLLAPFAVLFVQQFGWRPGRWLPAAVPAALPALGPAVFSLHLDRLGIERLAYVSVQEEWNRYRAWPWETVRCGVRSCEPIPGIRDGADWGWARALLERPTWGTVTDPAWREWAANGDTLELVCTALFVGLAVAGLRRLPFYHTAYVVPALVIPLLGPSEVHALMSVPRFGLVLFPLFVVVALVLDRPKRWAPAAVLSGALLILQTVQFSTWYWVS